MIGIGYDSHRLKEGGKLIIGGIEIESEFGTIAHSDGDVLIHSLVDALLGALAIGDIGELFPDTDLKYKDYNSVLFLEKVIGFVKDRGLKIVNIDTVIILEKIKLSKYKYSIRKKIASICDIDINKVSVKAKTNELMGFVGRGEGIAAITVCQLMEK
ncbi:MAG: 2-C-methyl-D-erythritol 2,4-cyclodiphosphate synthase [Candidatus Kapabacteria bacterium]|nr:2-C-methyl-D-erythritol 2,4-cyclodiphosphate synthase [Candidatus Kapabacteria bacterium]